MTAEIQRSIEIIQPKLDVLIVLGHNIYPGWTSKRIAEAEEHLSPYSRVTALAAGELYRQGAVEKLLFSTGCTAGKTAPSEAIAMKTFLLKKFPEIPETSIILEEISIDTAGNAEESARIVNKHSFKNIGLLTIGPHLENARTLFRRYGIEIPRKNCFISEMHAVKRSKNPDSSLEKFARNKAFRKEWAKEKLRSFLLGTIDRKGKLLHTITQRTRK